jgi:hypothetical protein
MEFGAALASCLHQFSGRAGVAVIGADESYGHLALPWGSNPATNHLLSGDELDIHTEGGGFTRTERVAFISRYPDIAARLRVCWEGPATGRNCGHCEKCIRTQMNFMADGQKPACFDAEPSLSQILRLRARNPVQVAYLTEILETARKNGVTAPWVRALQASISKNKTLLPIRPVEKRFKRLAKQIMATTIQK